MLAAKYTKRLIIWLLLVPCLFLVVMPHVPVDGPETLPGRKVLLFNPGIAGSAVSVFTVDKRTHSSSFDGLFKDALILGRIASITGEFSSFLAECGAGFAHSADRAAISIRGPPFF